jgi:flavin-dependent dehydrogenase
VATAVALVREGVDPARILVLDRARFPRAKPCGGGLTGHATSALAALGLALRVPSVPCTAGEVIFGGLRRTTPLGQPVHVIRREELDADLVAQARARGIVVNEGEGLAGFAVAGGRVRLETTAGRALEPRVLVGADGAGSLVRKHLLQGYARAPRQPLRLSRLELPAPRSLGQSMIYDFTPFADGLRGYVWLFPVPGGRVNVGIMHYPSSDLGGRALDKLLAAALARHGLTLPGPARGWPAWPYDARAPVSAPHLACVGDAAGIDALTGEGIAVGLEHGLLAGRAIARGLASGDLGFGGYARAIRRAVVGRELTLDGRLARLLYGSEDYRSWLGLVMFDDRMLELYAARVSGSEILADRKVALVGALARHLLWGRRRARALAAA